MDADQKRQLENEVVKMGLAGLHDPDLIQLLANLVSTWPGDKHRFLEDLINQCDADKRYEMYHAITPKLKFTALPLSTYEARIAERAGAMVAARRMRVEGRRPDPIEIGGEKFETVPESESTAAIATLKCGCGEKQYFLSTTPAGTMIMARKKGWVRDPGTNKEVCPDCMSDVERGAVA